MSVDPRPTPPQLQQARTLVARGFSIIPILPPAGTGEPDDGKKPAVTQWKPYQHHRPTDADLVQWFTRSVRNMAIVTGAISGIVVVDADDGQALRWCWQHLPYTGWQTRTARGFHLFYRHPGTPIHGRVHLQGPDGPLALDVRGDGNYVIAPGSVHASGVVYQEAGHWEDTREDIPQFSPRWITPAPRPSSPSRPAASQTGPVIDRGRRYLQAIPMPVIGAGSDMAVFRAAAHLVRGFNLSEPEAMDLLWEWCGGRPGWTYSWVAQKVLNASRYGDEPLGGLR